MAGTYSRREALEILGAAALAAPMMAVLGGCSNGGSAATTTATDSAASSASTAATASTDTFTPLSFKGAGESYWYYFSTRPAKDANFDVWRFHDGLVDMLSGYVADKKKGTPQDVQGMSDADVFAKVKATVDAAFTADDGVYKTCTYVTDDPVVIKATTDSSGNHVASESITGDATGGAVHKLSNPPTAYSKDYDKWQLQFGPYKIWPSGCLRGSRHVFCWVVSLVYLGQRQQDGLPCDAL